VDKWSTLETVVFSVAQSRLSKKLAELKQGQGAAKAFSKGIATFGDAANCFRPLSQSPPTHYRIYDQQYD
jgi:hypothetical protein